MIAEHGSGPSPRQKSPHAHGVALDPSGRFLLVADLGSDRIWIHHFNPKARKLVPAPGGKEASFAFPAGSGPRHIAFAPGGRYLVAITELTAQLQTFAWDAKAGKLTPLQTIETNSPGFAGKTSGAEIQFSPDGRFLYAANRGEQSLLVYRFDRASGHLTLLQRLASAKAMPWHFAIDPSGKWIVTANATLNTIGIFARDPATGRIRDTTRTLDSPEPVHILFAR